MPKPVDDSPTGSEKSAGPINRDAAAATSEPVSPARSAPPPPPRPTDRSTLLRWMCLAIALAGTAWLAFLLVDRRPAPIHWSVQVIFASLAIASALWSERQRRRLWEGPFRQLQELLPQIRAGEAPIDELSRIRGRVEPVIPLLQEILRDVRQQKALMAELNDEMSQRVAHRTDALARQVGSLRHQATRDALTGLFNRRMLDQHLPEIVEKCRKEHRELAVLMTDIDHFKKLNDTLGHASGDELLKAIGQIAHSTLREGDFAFRCGGDEFVILLVDVDLRTSQEMTERLISLTDAYGKNFRIEPSPRLSIGMSLLSEMPRATPDMLLQAADKALYDMKFTRKRAHSPPPSPNAKASA